MNITELRAQARTILRQTRGIYSLFLIPIVMSVLLVFLSPRDNILEEISGLELDQFLRREISRQIFPSVVNFILSIFIVSAIFAIMEILRKQRDQASFTDSFRAFSSEYLKYVFPTLLLKAFLLFLWNLVSWVGILLTTFASYKITNIYQQSMTDQTRTLSRETILAVNSYAPSMFLGLALLLIGLCIALPQYYAYSQTDFILYDQLANKRYQGSWQIIRQSRQMMKGQKGKRFLLDLSFIGWSILVTLTLGLASFYVYPYTTLAQALFYEKLKNKDN